MRRILTPVVSALLLLVVGGSLTACSFTEGICMDDEVTVLSADGKGGYCRARQPGDMECPDGKILRVIESTGREDCIQNDVRHQQDGLPQT